MARAQATELKLGEVLLGEGLITKFQLGVALKRQKESREMIGNQLIAMDFITPQELLDVLSVKYGLEYVELEKIKEIPEKIINKMKFDFCDEHQCLPFKEEDGYLYVAISNPQNITLVDDINFIVNQQVIMVMADKAELKRSIDRYYEKELGGIEELMNESADFASVIDETEGADTDLAKMADSRPVVKILNLVLKSAIEDQASDIHFEPYEDRFRVRYRVDGVLYEMESPPMSMSKALTARIKIISKLNISETRLPQDGRIPLTIEGRSVDLRVSILPTKFGESAVLRILDRSVVALDLHNLRLSEEDMSVFQRVIRKPSGIVLVTGPTGSGKTTTLYSCLNEINKPDIKIITNEDPVEYNIDGLIQVPINPTQGLTFAASLRAALRQDPDVILIGEIRDQETAEIAIESALTGHLVFSTLHTNDAPSTVTRLIDMGVESFLVTATLECIIAQRLVRTICSDCKEKYTPTEESLITLGINLNDLDSSVSFFRGRGQGCNTCRGSGYKGRLALYEVLEMNGTLRELILKEVSIQELQEAAITAGMKSLRQVGIQKIYDGLTTVDEVTQATVVSE